MDFKKVIQAPEYGFLKTNEHLGDNLVFLTLGGSHAYGTNIETSDIDVRGCAIERPCEWIGLSNFEQVLDRETDTTVYAFKKLVNLFANCNPNTIEMLGCKMEHYIYNTVLGEFMRENRKMFLSKRVDHAFGGYATSQLRRLENALARDRMDQARKEEHIRNSMECALWDFKHMYEDFDSGSVHLFVDDSEREDLDKEIFVDVDLHHFPARGFNSLMNQLKNVLDSYGKLNHRNKKKDDAHLNKHACHLIRLYLMELDILEHEEIVTYREKDHDLLMSIRNGEYQNEDGTYRKEFFDMVTELEERTKYAMANTSLPDAPNMKKIEEFVMDVGSDVITGHYAWLRGLK